MLMTLNHYVVVRTFLALSAGSATGSATGSAGRSTFASCFSIKAFFCASRASFVL